MRIIDALVARKYSNESKVKANKNVLSKIEKEIIESAKNGHYEVFFKCSGVDDSIVYKIIDILRDYGYDVEVWDTAGIWKKEEKICSIRISWFYNS